MWGSMRLYARRKRQKVDKATRKHNNAARTTHAQQGGIPKTERTKLATQTRVIING